MVQMQGLVALGRNPAIVRPQCPHPSLAIPLRHRGVRPHPVPLLPDDGRVVSNFTVQALQNKPISVFGDGTQTRSFCYVDDLVEGLVRLMDTTEEVTGPVNLGNPNEITVLQLAEKLIELTGSKSEILFEPLPQDDPLRRQPDISLAGKLLDWRPEVPLEEGLAKTIAYFDKLLG